MVMGHLQDWIEGVDQLHCNFRMELQQQLIGYTVPNTLIHLQGGMLMSILLITPATHRRKRLLAVLPTCLPQLDLS